MYETTTAGSEVFGPYKGQVSLGLTSHIIDLDKYFPQLRFYNRGEFEKFGLTNFLEIPVRLSQVVVTCDKIKHIFEVVYDRYYYRRILDFNLIELNNRKVKHKNILLPKTDPLKQYELFAWFDPTQIDLPQLRRDNLDTRGTAVGEIRKLLGREQAVPKTDEQSNIVELNKHKKGE